jgi:hypothetical protein
VSSFGGLNVIYPAGRARTSHHRQAHRHGSEFQKKELITPRQALLISYLRSPTYQPRQREGPFRWRVLEVECYGLQVPEGHLTHRRFRLEKRAVLTQACHRETGAHISSGLGMSEGGYLLPIVVSIN